MNPPQEFDISSWEGARKPGPGMGKRRLGSGRTPGLPKRIPPGVPAGEARALRPGPCQGKGNRAFFGPKRAGRRAKRALALVLAGPPPVPQEI